MGIIDDYLKTDDKKSTPEKVSGLVEQYLNAPEEKPLKRVIIDTTPKPPISGVTAEQSADINSQPSKVGGDNPRSILSLPANAAGAVYDAAKGGILTAGEGLGDIFAKKPATGIGKIGSGALSFLTSPVAGVEQLAGDVTGSKDIADRAGFVAGAAIPIVPGANAVSKAMPKNKALSELVDKITSNGREPEKLVETINAMKANPRIGPADTSPAVLNMAQKLFTTEGDQAKNYLHSVSSNRVKTSAATVNSAYDEAAGIPVNAVNKLKELSDAAKKVGNEKINPAIVGSKPVDLSDVVSHIDNILKPGVMQKVTGESTLPFDATKTALSNVKAMFANEKERLTDPQALHGLQSALRKEAEARMSSADGATRQLGYALMAVRNKIVDAIDAASPKIKDAEGKDIGSYKPALNNYREEKHISEAFHDAYNGVLTNSKKLENRPEFTKEWFDGLTEHEKKAAIEGIRTRIDTEIGVAKNPALAGTSLGKSAFNQKKMEAVLGKEETKKLLDTLEAERTISNTHNKIIEGSQTEMRRASEEAIALPEKRNGLQSLIGPASAEAINLAGGYAAGGTLPGAGAALYGLARAGAAAKDKIATALAKERNVQLAKMALPTEGPSRDQLIKNLESYLPGPKKSILNKASGLARLVGP